MEVSLPADMKTMGAIRPAELGLCPNSDAGKRRVGVKRDGCDGVAAKAGAICLLSLLLCACGHRTSNQATVPPLWSIAQIRNVCQRSPSCAPVRFRGIVTLVDILFQYVEVQDSTGAVAVQVPASVMSLAIGRRVEVVGSPSSGAGAGMVAEALIRDLGPGSLPAPIPLSAGNLYFDGVEGRRVAVSGVVCSRRIHASGQAILQLNVGGRRIDVRVVDDRGQSSPAIDADVTAVGIAAPEVDVDGKLTSFRMVAPDLASLSIGREAVEPRLLPVETLRSVLTLKKPPAHRIHVRGTLDQGRDATTLRLSDGTGSVPVQSGGVAELPRSVLVDVVGFLVVPDGRPALADVTLVAPLDSAGQRSAGGTAGRILTTAAAVRNLPATEAARHYPVSLDGMITYYDPAWRIMFFADATAGVFVMTHGARTLPVRAGDHVALKGVTGAGDFAPIVDQPQVRVLGREPFPEPVGLSTEETFFGRADSQWVELDGIVRDIHRDLGRPVAVLGWGARSYTVRFGDGDGIPPDWIDARVRVRGVCASEFNSKRQLLGIQLFVPGQSQCKLMEKSAPPFQKQVRSVGSLLTFSPSEAFGHTVHVRGTVVSTCVTGPTWLSDGTGGLVVRDHGEAHLKPGDAVDVAGFPVPGALSPELRNAVVRKAASGPPPLPARVNAGEALSGDWDAQLVQMDGRLIQEYSTSQARILLLQVGRTTFAVRGGVDVPAFENGAVLRVTGICSVSGDRVYGVAAPRSFELFLRSPSDIVVLRSAPWWNADRTLRALTLTLGLVVGVVTWVVLLRRRVRLQTRVIAQKLSEVQSLKEAAEAASRAKSQFLANMSHEIRTPMNGICGMTALALETNPTAEQREYLETVRLCADSLLDVINDILDLSKVEAGKLVLHEALFRLREMITATMRILRLRATDRGLVLDWAVDAAVPEILAGDAGRLRQVLVNLVGNAIKFTPAGGRIDVGVRIGESRAEDTQLRIAVQDTGMGIAADKLGRIFEPFVQADNSISREFGGTGLGLTISSRLVQMMQGEIGVTSTPGKGSNFEFTVRFRNPAPAEVAALEASATQQDAAVQSDRCLRILLAEDNEVNRRVAERMLGKRGHLVIAVGNGREAVETSEHEQFDVVLMDVQMPVMDGLEATRAIRQREQATGARLPIVALTAHAMAQDANICLDAGMDAYLAKPIHADELMRLLDRVSVPG